MDIILPAQKMIETVTEVHDWHKVTKKGLNKITQTTILLHRNALDLPGLLCVKEPSDRASSIYMSRLCLENM